MDLLDHDLARLARRRRAQRVYDALAPRCALALALAATAVVAVRLAMPALDWLALPLAVAGALAPLVGLPRALAVRDPRALLAGHLDQLTGGAGLAMALAEQPAQDRDAGWLARLRRPLEGFVPPPFAWRAGRGAVLALLALGAALALPQAQPTDPRQPPLVRFFDRAGAQLDALDRNGLLPPLAAQDLTQRLSELRAQAGRDGMDQTAWEALARVERDLASAGASAAQRLAEALTQAERASVPPAPGSTPAAHAAELAASLAALAAEAPGLVPRLDQGADAEAQRAALKEALRDAAGRGLITPEQLAALARLGLQPANAGGARLDEAATRALAERVGEELGRCAGRLGEAGVGDALQAALALLRGEALRRGRQLPGHSDGPGHLALERGEAERIPGATVAGLPPGARLNPDGSITLAEQMREPDAEQLAEATRAAARAFDPAAADARRASTAPRHRAAIERYFAAEPSTAPRAPAPAPR